MSNEENSFIRFVDDTITALNFIPATNYVLAPHGSPIWQGSPDELAALVRDARRFRKMEQAHEKPRRDGALYGWCYGSGIHGWMLQNKPLAELADALPDPTSDSASGTPPQG